MDLVKELGSTPPMRGFASSPIVDGDLLLLQAGGTEGRAVVALEKKTGTIRWTWGLDGYGTGTNVTTPETGETTGSSDVTCPLAIAWSTAAPDIPMTRSWLLAAEVNTFICFCNSATCWADCRRVAVSRAWADRYAAWAS